MSEQLTPNGVFNTISTPTSWQYPSYTWLLDYEDDNQIKGYCDERRAVEQAIFKILNTERYEYLIYSWNYGIELADLYGQPIPYVYAEIQRRIEEALLADDRISKVNNFVFSHNGGDVLVMFDAITEYGVIVGISKEVENIV